MAGKPATSCELMHQKHIYEGRKSEELSLATYLYDAMSDALFEMNCYYTLDNWHIAHVP